LLLHAPRRSIDDFHVEIDVRREVVADAEPCPLLHVEIVGGFADNIIGGGAGCVTGAGTSISCAETGVLAPFRPDTQVGAHPEILDVEVLADFGVVNLVGFLLRNGPGDVGHVGDLLTLRQLECRPDRRGETGDQQGRRNG
jgi:hypothetical protein